MKNIIALFCLFSFTSISLSAQNNYYWIKFKNKNNNPYSLSNPSAFLSFQAIQRRTVQQLSLDSTDLPITETYIDSILPFVDELKHRLKWINAVVVKLNTLENLDSIKELSFVDSIGGIEFFPSRALHDKFETEEAFTVDQHIIYPNKYGAAYHQINMLNADLLHQMGYSGSGITIALMDNGFRNVGTTPAFDLSRGRIVSTWDFVNNEADVYNEGDHGAQTFSCISANLPDRFIGTATEASYILNHTEDNSAEWVMEEYNWEAAAEASDSAGANVFSTSLGYTTFDDGVGSHEYKDLTGDKTVITHAGNMAFKKGILVLNSAGNEGAGSWFRVNAPADGNDVLAVGAVDSVENVSSFSSRGPNFAGRTKPDFCTQGSKSAVVASNGFISTSSGTSFSCPIAAGCVASLWSAFPDKKATDIRDAIMISCDNFWTPDSLVGYGIPNFYNAYLFLKTNYNDRILRVEGEMIVYPNPFNTDLNISMYNTNPRDGVAHKIEIFNLLGQQIFSREVYLRSATFEIVQLDIVKQLAAGEYILRVDGDKNNSYRVVKAK